MRHFSEGCSYSKENIVRTSAPPFPPDRSTFLAKFAKGNIYIPQTRKQIVRPPKAETCIHTWKCHAWRDWVLGAAIMLFDGDLFSLRLIRTTKTFFPLPGLWPRQFWLAVMEACAQLPCLQTCSMPWGRRTTPQTCSHHRHNGVA